jgi:hypothetical protein
VAPQTRKYWADTLAGYTDDEILGRIANAEEGMLKHAKTSTRHRHDWTIFRACSIREARRRGLTIPPSTL